MKNKKKLIITSSSVFFLIITILTIYNSKNNIFKFNKVIKSNINNTNAIMNNNIIDNSIGEYNVEDKYIEKTIDGHIVCRTDLNCLLKYYIECKSSDAVFFDKEVDAGFAFVVRGIVDNKCNIDIFSEKEGIDIKSTCNIPLDKLSKDSFNNLLAKTTRNAYEYCKN